MTHGALGANGDRIATLDDVRRYREPGACKR